MIFKASGGMLGTLFLLSIWGPAGSCSTRFITGLLLHFAFTIYYREPKEFESYPLVCGPLVCYRCNQPHQSQLTWPSKKHVVCLS